MDVAAEQMLWAAVSRAVRTPSRIDRDLSEPTPPTLSFSKAAPISSLKTVIAYELGYRAQLGPRNASVFSLLQRLQ